MPPKFRVEVEVHADHVQVVPHGEIDMATVDLVASAVREATGRRGGVVLDLRSVSFMDVEGLRLLLELSEQSSSEGWLLTMFRPSGPARRVIDLTASADQLPLAD
ncbi:MAG: anti-sigma factor antagonist [Solirubrobacteraceae bacterium]|jgi:anti-anti-sigma factor|nr:anti-sigma factor antagonist [Solirubrobacteraceae bacterium]